MSGANFPLSLLEKIRKNLSFERPKTPAVQSEPIHPNKLAEDWQRIRKEIEVLRETFEAVLAEGLARRERYETSLRNGVLPADAEVDGDLETSWQRIESLRDGFRETTLTVEVLSQAHAYYQDDRQRQMENARLTVSALREELEHIQTRWKVEIQKAKLEIADWEGQNQALAHRLERAETDKAQAEDARRAFAAQNDALNSQVEAASVQAEQERAAQEKSKKDLDAAQRQACQWREQTDALVKRLQELEATKQSLERDRETMRMTNRQLQDSLQERVRAHDRLALISDRKFQAVHREARGWKQQMQDVLCRMQLLNAGKEALETKLGEQQKNNAEMECESLRIQQSLEMELADSRQESEIWRQRTQDLYAKLAALENERHEAGRARALLEQQKTELESALQARAQEYGQMEQSQLRRGMELRLLLCLKEKQAAHERLAAGQNYANLKNKVLWLHEEARKWKDKTTALGLESLRHEQGHRLLWQVQADLLKEKIEIEAALAGQKKDFETSLGESRRAREALAKLLEAEQSQRSGWQQQARRHLADLEKSRQENAKLERRMQELEAGRSDLEGTMRQKEEDLEQLQEKSEWARIHFEKEKQQAEHSGLLRQTQIDMLRRQVETLEQEQRQSAEALSALHQSKSSLEALLREQKEENEKHGLEKHRLKQLMEEHAAHLDLMESQWQAREKKWACEREALEGQQHKLSQELQAGRQLFVQRLSACVDEIEFWKHQAQEKQPATEALQPKPVVEKETEASDQKLPPAPAEKTHIPAAPRPGEQSDDPLTQLRYFQEVVEKGGLFYKPPRQS